MANYFDRLASRVLLIGHGAFTAAAKTGLALDSNYAYETGGDAVAMRFCSPVTSNLVTVYAFMSAHGGTPGNLTCELRNWEAAAKPGDTLHDSTTADPGTTDSRWVTFDLSASPYQCVQDTTYFVVIGDAAGDGTNYATILYSGGPSDGEMARSLYSVRTTDGFVAALTEGYTHAAMVLEFADGTIIGMPYTVGTADTSNTLERGMKVTAFTESIVVTGVIFNPNVNVSGLKIYSGTTAPAGAADATYTFGTGTSTQGAARFAPFTCAKDTVYRFVFTYSGNSIVPGYFNNEDGSVADTITAGFGGGTMCRCIDNGAGGWTDTTNVFPRMGLIVKDQVAITAGSGGMLKAEKRGGKQ